MSYIVSFAVLRVKNTCGVCFIYFLNFHPFIYFDFFLLRTRTSRGTPTAFWKTVINR